MEADAQKIIGKLEERKRKLLEELSEVEFHLAAAIKYTKKRAYNPQQLAEARANRKNQEDRLQHRCDCLEPSCEVCFPRREE